jgi:PadR family transcriptional regulator, regulatory protein PadR
MDTWVTQFRRGLVEFGVLAVLRRDENYGYGIVESLNGIPGLEVTESTVYPLLARLANEGILEVRKQDSPSGPPRRYYRLTEAGRVRLKQMATYWNQIQSSLATLLDTKEFNG